ncbi:FtsX-like permease family protein [Bacillus sp. CDB3]|uniref:FtsX-like permease family protein n=1 Tax=Bacillus sp. CDB3 TaxID=360310 RepID=UPI0009D8FA21|nr:ABC transporter permease [Bacillus sp. CDB3]OQR54857.1 ABC transporter permease [Bacillus sp. CDB3]
MNFRQFAFKNITRNSSAYFAYFISSSFSIATFFSFAVYIFHPKLEDLHTIHIMVAIMNFSEVVIVVFSFFFLLYSIKAFLTVRKKQFAVLTILGIAKKQLYQLVFMENMLIGFFSLFFGMQFGLVFSQFFLLVTAKITHAPGIYLYWPTNAFILTTIVFLGLFIVVSAFTPMLIRTKKSEHLLKTIPFTQKECKISIIISLLGVICLMCGYALAGYYNYFSSLVDNRYSFLIIFVIPTLVTIGTYFFFRQTSFLLIYILKKRRKFYMKRINMLWISDLASRIRPNINMFFIVTMLSTISFTMIICLVSIDKLRKNDIIGSSPFAFSYFSYDANPFTKEHLTWLEQQLQKEGFLYKRIKVDLYETRLKEDKGEANDNDVYVMKQSDYNKLATSLHLKQIFIKDNEAYFVEPIDDRKYITLSNTNQKLQVKTHKHANALPSEFSYKTLVLSDNFEKNSPNITRHITAYNYNVQNWKKTHKIANAFIQQVQQDRKKIQYEGPLIYPYEAANSLVSMTSNNNSFFLIGAFLGAIFFIGAGSVLYFRIYTDLTNEQRKYVAISKIGATDAEVKRSATIQLSILYFVPYIVASIHTVFATKLLQDLTKLSLFTEASALLSIFVVVEIIFSLAIRSFYMKKLLRYINN